LDYWKIDRELLLHVAKIARLELTEEEIKKFLPQLNDILKNFKKIDEVDVSDTSPSIHPIEIKNVWREDKFKPFIWRPLAQTKYKEKKFFKGPRIV
jgi:aspartyl-tRNA(Asn)/glutamyl-tRNA(Gln) amidotransferase subunit C